mmetsp:Transcript_26901/g.64750  ORF Transcript_26901/g.64750 Transcript_26901/m.64750 type:complete len:82 (+) Transcript_26901:974-1219(+)
MMLIIRWGCELMRKRFPAVECRRGALFTAVLEVRFQLVVLGRKTFDWRGCQSGVIVSARVWFEAPGRARSLSVLSAGHRIC